MIKVNFVLPLFVLLLTGCKQETLLQDLDQIQANEVIALLQRNNIQAAKIKTAKEGYVVSIDPLDFTASVDLINSYGLPRPSKIDIAQMFPADSLVSSPRAEKARLYSGIEQRLAQSINMIGGVVSAQVHVSYSLDDKEDAKKNKESHLAAIVNYDDRVIDRTLLISDIKKFLKNSFDDINYDNISVVLSEIDLIQRTPPVKISQSPVTGLSLMFSGIAIILGIVFIISAFKRSSHSFIRKIKYFNFSSDAIKNKKLL